MRIAAPALGLPAELAPSSAVFEWRGDRLQVRGLHRRRGHASAFRLDDGHWRELVAAADARLPLAAHLDSRDDLARFLADRFETVERCQVVAYRPRRRLVLKLTGFRKTRRQVYYLKGFRATAFDKWKARHQALENARLASHLALPVAAWDDGCALLFAAQPGPCLHDPDLAGFDIAALDALLGAFANDVSGVASSWPRRELEDERASTLTMLARARGFVPEVDELEEFVRTLRLPDPSQDVGWVHGDLHDKQVFFAPKRSRCRVIDLDTLAVGPTCLDRVNLAEHLRWRLAAGHWSDAETSRRILEWTATCDEIPGADALRRLVRARLAAVHAARPTARERARGLAQELLQSGGLG